MRARVSRKWYLVVIVLLYIGLLASFSLNVTLLMRKPVLNQVTFPETDGELSFDKLYSKLDKLKLIIFSIYMNVGYFLFPGYPPATTPTSDIRRTEKNTQLGFAYTTPCLVTGDINITCSIIVCSQSVSVPCESGFMYDCNSGECQQCPHGSYQPQWGNTHYIQRKDLTQIMQARPPAGLAPLTPPQTGPGPPVWTCASLTLAPSMPR